MIESMRKAMANATTGVVPEVQANSTEWRVTGLVLCLAGLCVFGLYAGTVRSMVETWASSRTFAHGFLVLPVTGYLVWCSRDQWMHLKPAPNAWGVAALGLCGGGWFVGAVTDVLWLQQAAVVAMLPGVVWTILGKDIAGTLSWPLGFLVFLIPVGTAIEPWLQDMTAWFIQVGLHALSIPYSYDNYLIVISSGVWRVDPDCGGLRYLLPGLALGYMFVTLMYRQPVRRVGFLLLCAVMLMVANGIRAYGVIVGDHFGIAAGADHRLFSYTVYGLTMPLLLWLGLKWQGTEPATLFPARTPFERPGGFAIREQIFVAIAATTVLALFPLAVWLWFGSH